MNGGPERGTSASMCTDAYPRKILLVTDAFFHIVPSCTQIFNNHHLLHLSEKSGDDGRVDNLFGFKRPHQTSQNRYRSVARPNPVFPFENIHEE